MNMNQLQMTACALMTMGWLLAACESGGDSAEDVADLVICEFVSPSESERSSSPLTVTVRVMGLEVGSVAQLSLTSSLAGALVERSVSENGQLELDPLELASGVHELTLRVEQGSERCEARHTARIKGPPTVAILTPTTSQSFMVGAVIPLTASVDDPDEPLDSLSLTWRSSLDGDLGQARVGLSGLSEPMNAELSVGRHTLSARVEDQDAFVAEASVDVVISGPPSAPELVLVPEEPTTGDDLEVFVVGMETEDVGYSYAWRQTGLEEVVSTESVLPHASTSKGESWTVTVAGMRGGVMGEGTDASVVIVNSAPTVDSVVLSPVPTRVGDTVTCVYSGYEDADDDLDQSVSWWFVNDVAAGAGQILTGGFTGGDELRCDLIPFDGELSGAPVSKTLVVTNTLPAAPSVSLSSAAPQAGVDALICIVDASQADPDGDDVDVEILWWRDGSLLTDNGASMGVTTTTFELDTVPASLLIAGEQWTCSVTARDAEGSSSAGSASATVVEPEPVSEMVEDFALLDTNATSARFGEEVSPRDYLGGVSAWYFGHAT